MLFQVLQIAFNITEGERICFEEDLPEAARLKGIFSADMESQLPQVALQIAFKGSELFGRASIGQADKFDMLTSKAGEYDICFFSVKVDSHPTAKRLVQFDIEMAELPGVQSGKTESAMKIKEFSTSVIKEESYGLERMDSLTNLGNEASRTVFGVGLLCILITVAVISIQAYWLTVEIKKRS